MDSQPVEKNVPAEQVEALVRESAALAAALRAARVMRVTLLLGLVLIVAAISWLVYQKYNQLTSEKNIEQLRELAAKHLENNQDRYMRQVRMLVDKVSPPITEAFQTQAKKDTPKYLEQIDKERDPFMNGLQEKLTARLKKHYEGLKPEYAKILAEEFPVAKDKNLHEAILVNTDKAVDRLLTKYYVDDLRDELLVAFHTWDTFPVAGPAPKDNPLEDQFQAALLELFTYKLTHPQR
jgi:hypothetical protein